MAERTELKRALQHLADGSDANERARLTSVDMITTHLNDPENYTNPAMPSVISGILDLFRDEKLTKVEESKIAQKISVPMLDKGLEYWFETPDFIASREYPDDKFELIEALRCTVRAIVSLKKNPVQDYDGKNIRITNGDIRIG